MRLTSFKLKITKFNCNNVSNSLRNLEITNNFKMDPINNKIKTSLLYNPNQN